ncbi:hypothetical protein D0Y60_13515 [Shinella sp. WSJ-2]|uniref:hypothetical protein n=1 Tax=Shinella sp. WSJ-2 TaxID=2303749 RepID=UPI000E3DB890|nr:hypothetical protein [Shinella sp. WSJ-2]RFZ87006.1 hypothetical protein D0Y60_13515 [Shinella sp. WSJ-2]
MADFVAVIRRAVDGLSDNNAEMRQKVYEKARGAVRRQLESMNPRPSDDLVKRQLDKLEMAISDVEGEHAEALPADDLASTTAQAPVVEVAEPEPVEAAAEEPAAVDEPEQQPVEAVSAAEEPVAQSADNAQPEQPGEENRVEDRPVEETVAETVAVQDQVSEPAPEPEPVAETVAEAPVVDEPEERPAVVEEHVEPSWQVEAVPADEYVPSWQEQERQDEAQPVDAAAVVEPVAEAYPVHDELLPDAAPVADARMPAAEAQWDWSDVAPVTTPANKQEPAVAAATDPMAWEWPEEKTAQAEEPKQAQPAQKSEWGDLDDLIGFTPTAGAAAATASSSMEQAGLADAATKTPAIEARTPQRSFRAEPRKSRINFGAIAALIGVIAIAGGAGAGYWFNRDAVNDWVNERIASLTASSPATKETPEATTESAEGGRNLPATTTTNDTTAAGTQTDGAATKPATEVASADQSSGKFTQRLLTDGTEVDEGPAAAPEGVSTEEGKSVAAQTPETAEATTETGAGTAAGTTGGATTPATGTDGTTQTPVTTTDTGTATTTDTQTPAATGEQPAAIGVAQKMFLYEERLGQTAPTAIEGTVAWSSAEESPGGDAKPEPVVRAQVNVPSKGLTALITFRRNADKSLPASHIVELVFSLPENFEGGGIESVQRVAMKRTEQDRGDALIAVPAKITDDFHMIALNDFPEAIAKNTELLRTRSWIDIPITYRNGRRALITLDKGTAGAEAFDKVMKAWSTAGTQ